MGVNGFTPFLQKKCSSVFKVLPNRFQELKGKRIIIDGTLITQRFHYGATPHPSRHVLGWYRIANEIRDSGASAICVFDGKGRHSAKAQEINRRKESQKLTAQRSVVEDERFQRLEQMREALLSLKDMDSRKRLEVVTALRTANTAASEKTEAVSQRPVKEFAEPSMVYPSEPTSLLPEAFIEAKPRPAPRYLMNRRDKIVAWPARKIVKLLKSLYVNFRDTVVNLVKISTTRSSDELPFPSSDLEVKDPYTPLSDTVMTKAQHSLAMQEGQIWQNLDKYLVHIGSQDTEIWETIQGQLDSILDKSQAMVNSFRKRIDQPTAQTYRDSQEILRAMGIPCIETTDRIEAEALAASMVLDGHGDYVATEDTDVLVYEAPMLKNLTSLREPFVAVAGNEIRQLLQLDPEAYIDCALLFGTDFLERIPNIGPVRAYQFIKQYRSIENILESVTKYPPKSSKESYLTRLRTARTIFRNRPPVPPLEHLQRLRKDDALVDTLMEQHSLSQLMHEAAWGSEVGLVGNYYDDNPEA